MPEARPPLPNPDPVNTKPVVWKVISPHKALPEGEYLFYGLNQKHFENLRYNQAETLRWVTEAHWLLLYYLGGFKEEITK